MTTNTPKTHELSYRKLTAVWLALMVLTALTVGASRIPSVGIPHVLVSLAIAILKGGLVVIYFMHMCTENKVLRWFLFVALTTLTIFIGFTFFDVVYR